MKAGLELEIRDYFLLYFSRVMIHSLAFEIYSSKISMCVVSKYKVGKYINVMEAYEREH